ncbi:hypothetical protein SAMN05216266_10723 [Amycolatopsis marina]|uniref:Uncharacterized protein n=1 Tax=Amycolatopsis marina TaxID=490629 RepID=A0A1I0ZIW8_9PSEU|nr:hypothetical protein [Amycolatopsis marina]SFB25387.1 hypothetical protein SAMN05216266_10723 [Amycolatopsis marina]
MTTNQFRGPGRWQHVSAALNSRWHRAALAVFTIVVLAHWAEHLAQAVQIYLLGWPVPEANGALGLAFPALVKSEWLHYGYAVGMMVAFVVLRRGFTGRSRPWWRAAMWIQIWHHFEHLLLLLQALTGAHLLGNAKPTSIVQLVIPRVELHLFYNTIVFVPMVVAMVYHLRPRPDESALMRCSCTPRSARAVAASGTR